MNTATPDIEVLCRDIRQEYYANPDVNSSRVYEAGCRFLTREIYLLWNNDRSILKRVMQIGGAALLAADVIDDEIDRQASDADKLEVFDTAAAHLLEGDCRCKPSCEGIFLISKKIHQIVEDANDRFRQTCQDLVLAGREQITDTSVAGQERAMRLMGKTSMSICLDAGEYASKKTASENIRNAVEALGEYTYMYDVAYEVEDDRREGNMSYATCRIDSGESTNDVQRDIIRRAKYIRSHGLQQLDTTPQRIRYNAMAYAASARYRLK